MNRYLSKFSEQQRLRILISFLLLTEAIFSLWGIALPAPFMRIPKTVCLLTIFILLLKGDYSVSWKYKAGIYMLMADAIIGTTYTAIYNTVIKPQQSLLPEQYGTYIGLLWGLLAILNIIGAYWFAAGCDIEARAKKFLKFVAFLPLITGAVNALGETVTIVLASSKSESEYILIPNLISYHILKLIPVIVLLLFMRISRSAPDDACMHT